MSEELSIREIESQLSIGSPPEPTSKLETWYMSIRDKRPSGFSDEDLCIACRQQVFENYIVPVAISRLGHNPLAGEKYDGELIVALTNISSDYWSKHKSEAHRLTGIVNAIMDDEVKDYIESLLDKMGN